MSSVNIFERTDVVSGMWKFSDRVGPDVLTRLAYIWKDEEPGKYLGPLSVRKCSKDQLGIQFMYIFGEGDHKEFFRRVTDFLKRQFGNNYVGYDIGSPTWITYSNQ